MNLVIVGLVLVIASIGITKFSGFLGAIIFIIGLSIMIKGKKQNNV